jgi:putative ABC transport system permease protein
MNLIEGVRIALRALTANKLRATLTMLGIIIGVMSVVALLSIGQGARASITGQIQGIGSNLIYVTPGQLREGGVSTGVSAATLTLDDAEAIAANVPDIVAVAPEYSRNTQVVYREQNTNTRVVGTTPEYTQVRNVYPAQGEFFSPSDNTLVRRVAVLGPDVAQDLFGGRPAVGATIKIDRIPFHVVGIMESKGGSGMGGNQDANVYIPINTAHRYFGGRAASGGRLVTTINVSAVSEEKVDAVSSDIIWLLRRRHNIRNDQDDFSVLSQKDILNVAGQVTGILTVFLGAIAGISLLVGGIGIMNIMLVSVTERTREIGLRKAVGAQERDILIQFLIEAITLSVLGGLLGILLGVGIAQLVNLSGLFTAVVTSSSVLLAVSFAVLVGLFFGIYPARRAAMLNPIDALRYE